MASTAPSVEGDPIPMRSNKVTLNIRIRRLRNRILRRKHLIWRLQHRSKAEEAFFSRFFGTPIPPPETTLQWAARQPDYIYAGPTRYPKPNLQNSPDGYAEGY